MNNRVQLNDKKQFLKWFLQRYQMKRRESMWILNYLLNHDIVLNKAKFVERAEKTPRGIKMAAVGSENEAFKFYKDGHSFDNPEQAFHEVRLNWHTDLYIELLFSDAWMSAEYLAVLEDNPFSSWNDSISNDLSLEVNEAIDHFQLSEKRNDLVHQIDIALENDEKERFLNLTRELKEIEEKLSNELPY
ncbi:ReoY family proteolytic degradation factor [Marinilactibacillus sp. XAAS-LB27]|uniref:ReoY family proteolytic degradation factor n=1 Tax=Marinilactibacillus sp. XAAS-LB27 TaxID=3114538 RepID=UPI002E18F0B5|nr:ReoY family proteolytic degradation factor [Marinilactibacillus sp. XAAS-LB27]